MTDSEKLDLLLNKASSIESDVSELKTDVSGLKSNFSGLKGEVTELKATVSKLENNFSKSKRQVVKAIAELKAMDEMILDEVERVHSILNMHKEDSTIHLIK